MSYPRKPNPTSQFTFMPSNYIFSFFNKPSLDEMPERQFIAAGTEPQKARQRLQRDMIKGDLSYGPCWAIEIRGKTCKWVHFKAISEALQTPLYAVRVDYVPIDNMSMQSHFWAVIRQQVLLNLHFEGSTPNENESAYSSIIGRSGTYGGGSHSAASNPRPYYPRSPSYKRPREEDDTATHPAHDEYSPRMKQDDSYPIND